ncbi:hypothetical protein DAT35_01505 [Vitiosangium sp. GDMCC 1.1324]|nr:hypothetical protein DAT35_01505 [Vitiosangium sp. GDMCC 1.1324]
MGQDAEQPPVRGFTKLDIGVSAGFNSPAGIYGGEIEYRALPWLGLNASGGVGAWGLRVGPLVRLYPLGARGFSPFAEAGVSFNLGSEVYSEINGERRYADQLFTPVATASLGARIALGSRLYLTPRVGWAFRLREDNFQMRDGNPPDSITDAAVFLTQHGGFLTSLAFGVAIF